MSYNLDEGMGDNHYNCPVVAYYPEVIGANVAQMQRVRYINDYVACIGGRISGYIHKILCKYFIDIGLKDVKAAANAAYAEYKAYLTKVRVKGEEYLALAKEKDLPVILLAGARTIWIRNQSRDRYIDLRFGCGRDFRRRGQPSDREIPHQSAEPVDLSRPRLYAAAKLVGEWNDARINLVQLVSFGCGVDAITTDEVRRILEEKNRIYTQIKIDEITNLGAVKIRLRSLFAALGLGKEAAQ